MSSRAQLIAIAAAFLIACSSSGEEAGVIAPDAACLDCDVRCSDDLLSDPRNCGSCGHSCGSGEICDAGTCSLHCSAETVRCGDRCIDVRYDPAHCGACDVACSTDQRCSLGMCASECRGGSTACGSACVDLQNDPAHCGTCETSCALGESCVAGVCSLVCGVGTTRCGTKCADVRNDPSNCGACGAVCATTEVCVGGTCKAKCPGGATACGEKCVDLANDPANCGACAKACGVGEVCREGACAFSCGTGTTLCAGRCVDLKVDPTSCGYCGNICPSGATCTSGYCACKVGYTCGGKCIEPATDPLNCGGCGNKCITGQICDSGKCACTGGKSVCTGTCVDLANDIKNCGACAATCSGAEICSGGACTCPTSALLCGTTCVDPKFSPLHCGACGKACASSEVCNNGVCVASAGAWPTFGGDVAHTGVQPAALGTFPLTLAWSKAPGPGRANPVVVAGNRLFTSYELSPTTPHVFGLRASDGSLIWSKTYDKYPHVGVPTVSGSDVYVASVDGVSTQMWRFDAATGTGIWAAPFPGYSEHLWSPIVIGTRLFTAATASLAALETESGLLAFKSSTIEQYDSWAPAHAGGRLFTLTAGTTRAFSATTGAEQWKTVLSTAFEGSYSMGRAPSTDGTRVYVVVGPRLFALDCATGAVVWSAWDSYAGTVAVAGGVVYATSGGTLHARSAATGLLLWTFAGDSALKYPPIVSNGAVYVASDMATFAVDTTTHAQVWHGSVGGYLVLAASRLFVSSTTGAIHAFTFSP